MQTPTERASRIAKERVAKIEQVEGEFKIAMDKKESGWSRIKAFFRGENKAGRKAGAVLDIVTVFLPFGVQTAREAAQTIIERKEKPPMKKAIARALTRDGGGFVRVRNEQGEIDMTAILATVIRAAIIIGISYACVKAGVDPSIVFGVE